MTNLKKLNHQECFVLLKQFIDAVNVTEDNLALQEKKTNALSALEQLRDLEKKASPDATVTGGSCGSLALACIQ